MSSQKLEIDEILQLTDLIRKWKQSNHRLTELILSTALVQAPNSFLMTFSFFTQDMNSQRAAYALRRFNLLISYKINIQHKKKVSWVASALHCISLCCRWLFSQLESNSKFTKGMTTMNDNNEQTIIPIIMCEIYEQFYESSRHSSLISRSWVKFVRFFSMCRSKVVPFATFFHVSCRSIPVNFIKSAKNRAWSSIRNSVLQSNENKNEKKNISKVKTMTQFSCCGYFSFQFSFAHDSLFIQFNDSSQTLSINLHFLSSGDFVFATFGCKAEKWKTNLSNFEFQYQQKQRRYDLPRVCKQWKYPIVVKIFDHELL